MKRADASGAAYAVIMGADEVAAGTAIFKSLRSGLPQESVEVDRLTECLIDAMVSSAELDEDDDAVPPPSETRH